MQDALFVGIDVAKAELEVASYPEGLRLSLTNDAAGIEELLEALGEREIALVVMEATGGYERPVAGALVQAGLPAVVVNPRQVREFARGIGKLAKTDRIDAEVLARFAEVVRPEPRPAKGSQGVDLAELVTRRRQLTGLLTQEKNRSYMTRHPRVKKSVEKVIKTLKREIAQIDELIGKNIHSDDEFRKKDKILRSTPGVGPQTSAMLVAHLPELGLLNRQGIAALVGLAPWDSQSGDQKKKSKIWGGREHVRSALYMAALTAWRCNPTIKSFAERLRAEGKCFKVVITACMRKLLIILNTMIKENTPWHPRENP